MLAKVLKCIACQCSRGHNRNNRFEFPTQLHPILARALALIIVSISVASCQPKSTADMGALQFSQCTPPKGQTPIPESQCASVSVPENPADITSRSIDIHFLRIKAVDAKPESDPLVLIQGGPGGSSQTMAYSLYRYFTSVRQKRDLLFIDLRGTGESNPLDCPRLETITAQMSDQEALQKYRVIMADCAHQYENNSHLYTTAYAVADLETIRSRLGYRQFNVWGASYGSRVAMEYAATYPTATRSLVLDGLAPRAISLPRFIARDAKAAFEQLNEYCRIDAQCSQHYGDLAVHAEKIIAALQSAETAQTPIEITLADPLNQQPKQWIFTPRRFAQLIISALYSRELTSLAPRALKEAAEGNYQLLATINALAEASNGQLSITEGLYYSVICNEDLLVDQKNQAADGNFFGVDLVADKLAVCAHWPKTEAASTTKAATISTLPLGSTDAPTLLLSGALDPVTPKTWADQVAQTHPHHQSILVPGGNHVVSVLGCMPNLIAQFIRTPNAKLPADCAANIATLPLYLGADTAEIKDASPSDSKANSR